MICNQYTGVSCVDGSCPIANRDIYAEYGIPLVWTCENCPYYHGCEDCCFDGSELCTGKMKTSHSL